VDYCEVLLINIYRTLLGCGVNIEMIEFITVCL